MEKSRIIILACIIMAAMWLPTIQQECLSQEREIFRPYTDRHKHIMLVDMPTGCLLERGTFDAGMRIFPEGGVLGSLSVGIADRFMFGITFGGTNVIGKGSPKWNEYPGVNLKYFLMEESINRPAVSVGFDSQGYGPYIKKAEIIAETNGMADTLQVEVNRYAIKSRGLFFVISKGYVGWKNLNFGMHLGINRSLEVKDGDKDPTVFLGFDLELGNDVIIVGEYDFATNDDGGKLKKRNRGYLNAGIRWTFMDRIYIDFDFKGLLDKENDLWNPSREIKIAYVTQF